ncbi:hypothetical protein [Stigmatella aurantiaca]|uniref:hypothetical protein n=1 Tax=Stigmatella aurantiaca TaxID=41 RepID=UPI0011D2BA9B|nr:hypothetical protein [Stigmatella aurantiaca]
MVGSVWVLGGCGVDAGGHETGVDEAASLATTEQAISTGWTAYTSDERPPVNCDGSSLVSAAQCSGDYCDNMRLYCQPTTGVRGDSYWTTSYVYAGCRAGYWITGLSCNDSYCTTLAVQCTAMINISPKNCYSSGVFSDEDGPLYFPAGYYPTYVNCAGSYCDRVSFKLCQM